LACVYLVLGGARPGVSQQERPVPPAPPGAPREAELEARIRQLEALVRKMPDPGYVERLEERLKTLPSPEQVERMAVTIRQLSSRVEQLSQRPAGPAAPGTGAVPGAAGAADEVLGGAAPIVAKHAYGVRLVDVDSRAVFASEVHDVRKVGRVAFHGKDPVDNDHPAFIRLKARQNLLQIRHVVVPKAGGSRKRCETPVQY